MSEAMSLPPPSSLFGSSSVYPPKQTGGADRPMYILPPPQGLPFTKPTKEHTSYATPTPSPPSHASQYYQASHGSPPPASVPCLSSAMPSSSNDHLESPPLTHQDPYLPTPVSTPVDESSPPKVERRKRKTKKQMQEHQNNPYYKVMALTTKKKKKIDDISAAAATLTSFTQSAVLVDRKRKQKFLPVSGSLEEGCLETEDCAGNGKYVCPHCGLTYQHGICLQRHTWDHTLGWSNRPTGSNKRQQVQVLEAAHILMEIATKGVPVTLVD
ncbi:hypothetical protein DM01DRAFT_1332712 [Hesseltinella vesiculosa]|uniref:C2H2-type domain-containing protein n=1 Tax=Hesseltinella vesiculosa TaxID=101127 RepID=A0A1X2GST3_9FUNG|nr:hypothetical protein DM01DRAFT_1332712 [Hesseltinella vesiculosa]